MNNRWRYCIIAATLSATPAVLVAQNALGAADTSKANVDTTKASAERKFQAAREAQRSSDDTLKKAVREQAESLIALGARVQTLETQKNQSRDQKIAALEQSISQLKDTVFPAMSWRLTLLRKSDSAATANAEKAFREFLPYLGTVNADIHDRAAAVAGHLNAYIVGVQVEGLANPTAYPHFDDYKQRIIGRLSAENQSALNSLLTLASDKLSHVPIVGPLVALVSSGANDRSLRPTLARFTCTLRVSAAIEERNADLRIQMEQVEGGLRRSASIADSTERLLFTVSGYQGLRDGFRAFTSGTSFKPKPDAYDRVVYLVGWNYQETSRLIDESTQLVDKLDGIVAGVVAAAPLQQECQAEVSYAQQEKASFARAVAQFRRDVSEHRFPIGEVFTGGIRVYSGSGSGRE